MQLMYIYVYKTDQTIYIYIYIYIFIFIYKMIHTRQHLQDEVGKADPMAGGLRVENINICIIYFHTISALPYLGQSHMN